jgi:hypothetical protein
MAASEFPSHNLEHLERAGIVRTPLVVEPGAGCPGRYHAGRMLGLCSTQCARMGGKELVPAATVVLGHAACVNHLPLDGNADSAVADHASMVPGQTNSGHPAELGPQTVQFRTSDQPDAQIVEGVTAGGPAR